MADFDPQDWLKRLTKRLTEDAREIEKLEAYYEGKARAPEYASVPYQRGFHDLLKGISDNWMPLIVDAVEERLHVEGFRMSDDPEADADAWTLWQKNFLDADSELAHSAALMTGRAAVLVWPDKDGKAEITVEHPCQVKVAYEAGSRRRRVAAVKQWVDEWTEERFANVYLPDGIWKFKAPKGNTEGSTITWTAREAEETPNPFGVVPIVELINRPRLNGSGRSEIAEALSVQDQINKLLCDMLVASEFGAFRQRWATGVELPTDPDTGRPLEPFKAAIDRIWMVPDPSAKFGEFSETNLANYVKAIENRVQSLASRTRTPPHYLLGQSGSFPSGESLKATETGLIAKCRSRMKHFGERWEEIIRLGFKIEGDERQDAVAAETIWADPESRSESEHVDSLVKKLALGVPKEQLWEDAGYSPQQIARMKRMLLDEAFNRLLAGENPLAPPPPPPVSANGNAPDLEPAPVGGG